MTRKGYSLLFLGMTIRILFYVFNLFKEHIKSHVDGK